MGLKPLLGAETLGAAQQHAGLEAVAGEEVEQGVGEEGAARAVALAEVDGELEAVLVQSAPPMVRPSATAPIPSARLTTTLRTAAHDEPSSARRWVSSIQVEKVV